MNMESIVKNLSDEQVKDLLKALKAEAKLRGIKGSKPEGLEALAALASRPQAETVKAAVAETAPKGPKPQGAVPNFKVDDFTSLFSRIMINGKAGINTNGILMLTSYDRASHSPAIKMLANGEWIGSIYQNGIAKGDIESVVKAYTSSI